MSAIALKAIAAWLLILVCAVLNGALREAVLIPQLGQVAGLVASGVLLCLFVLSVSVALVPWFGPLRAPHYLLLGLLWLCLTLAFEFGFGRLVEQRTWATLLEAYTFKGGNLWPFVLIVTALAPLMAARIRGLL